jgi:signal transduction histidine kinase
MSHELRTPLNVILAFAQVLKLSDLSEDQEEAVDQIMKSGAHLLELIDEVLELSRLDAREARVAREALDIEPLAREVARAFRDDAAAANVVLQVEPSRLPVQAVGDRAYLKEVLVNLVSNAVKYCAGGEVRIGWSAEDGTARITVSDTGPGIDAEHLPLLFVPFERLGAETTEIEGTGLGLTIARALARAMRGRLEVESVVGEGSTFTLTLPGAMAQRSDA